MTTPPPDQPREIEYRAEELAKVYPRVRMIPLFAADGPHAVPYEMMFDYLKCERPIHGWGNVTITGTTYHLPAQLFDHRDSVLEAHPSHHGKNPHESVCPRLSRFWVSDTGTPTFEIENATYLDQVATNLYPDRPIAPPVQFGARQVSTVRAWDQVTAGVTPSALPKLEQSHLANTIGVAIGMTALREKDGKPVSLWRRRRKDVRVYPGMAHLPFSFALNIKPQKAAAAKRGDWLSSLIDWDLNAERAEELGMEAVFFDDPQPLAWCRDLPRAGKPQLFLDMRCRLPYEELRTKIRDVSPKREYERGVFAMHLNDALPEDPSPEFACYVALKRLAQE